MAFGNDNGNGNHLENGSGNATALRVSVIIPVLDDAPGLKRLLRSLRRQTTAAHEVLVVDGGSRDGGLRLAQEAGSRTLRSAPGRGRQMAEGARAARGDVFWFLHADTTLRAQATDGLLNALRHAHVVGGKFPLSFPHHHPVLDMVATLSRYPYKWTSYGDGGFFVRREVYEAIGGMESVPLFEDVRLFERLKRAGEVAVVPEPLQTSCRRFCREGPLRRISKNMLLVAAHQAGVSPQRLAGWYGEGNVRCRLPLNPDCEALR